MKITDSHSDFATLAIARVDSELLSSEATNMTVLSPLHRGNKIMVVVREDPR